MGRVEPATVVDHIVPHNGNHVLFWRQDNWQPCCDWHHNAVKKKLELLFKDKQVDITDLRLDSPKAVAIAKDTPRRVAIGVDGWPVS
jgi:5-methylcytosine-specific restriction protein A